MKRQNDGVDVQGKSPCFTYYPADVERDVQILSLAAQGLWLRMLGWMHFCQNRGFLELPTGIPMTESDIAAKVGKSNKEVTSCIREMERIGLFSRDERGCIFSRRMVKDSHISRVRKEAAAARLLVADRDNHGRFAGSNIPIDGPAKTEQNTVLSSSSSSSPKGNTDAAAKTPEKWARRLYERKKKKKNKPLVEYVVLKLWESAEDPESLFAHIDRVHAAKCSTHDWQKNDGNFAPKLDEWLSDDGYKVSIRKAEPELPRLT